MTAALSSLVKARAYLYEAVIVRHAGDAQRATRAAGNARMHADRSGSVQLQIWSIQLDHDAPHAIERLEGALRQARAGSMIMAEVAVLDALGGQHGRRSERTLMRHALQAALGIARQLEARTVAARFENNLGTDLVRTGSIDEGRVLLLSSLTTRDRIGWRLSALYPLGGLAEAETAAGNWRNAVILFSATYAVARSLGFMGLANLSDAEEDAAVQTAEEHLGPSAAAEARATGARMTYREAVDFAYEINGVA